MADHDSGFLLGIVSTSVYTALPKLASQELHHKRQEQACAARTADTMTLQEVPTKEAPENCQWVQDKFCNKRVMSRWLMQKVPPTFQDKLQPDQARATNKMHETFLFHQRHGVQYCVTKLCWLPRLPATLCKTESAAPLKTCGGHCSEDELRELAAGEYSPATST